MLFRNAARTTAGPGEHVGARGKLGDDWSEAHLEKYFSEIVGTSDGINTWMQDHSDDYR